MRMNLLCAGAIALALSGCESFDFIDLSDGIGDPAPGYQFGDLTGTVVNTAVGTFGEIAQEIAARCDLDILTSVSFTAEASSAQGFDASDEGTEISLLYTCDEAVDFADGE